MLWKIYVKKCINNNICFYKSEIKEAKKRNKLVTGA